MVLRSLQTHISWYEQIAQSLPGTTQSDPSEEEDGQDQEGEGGSDIDSLAMWGVGRRGGAGRRKRVDQCWEGGGRGGEKQSGTVCSGQSCSAHTYENGSSEQT